jgi:hypothetical protein
MKLYGRFILIAKEGIIFMFFPRYGPQRFKEKLPGGRAR